VGKKKEIWHRRGRHRVYTLQANKLKVVIRSSHCMLHGKLQGVRRGPLDPSSFTLTPQPLPCTPHSFTLHASPFWPHLPTLLCTPGRGSWLFRTVKGSLHGLCLRIQTVGGSAGDATGRAIKVMRLLKRCRRLGEINDT
jgi:hypothetical protein